MTARHSWQPATASRRHHRRVTTTHSATSPVPTVERSTAINLSCDAPILPTNQEAV
jgi:hypothetical protein